MRIDLQERLEAEYQGSTERLKKPSDLFMRSLSDDDFVDSAVVGGVSIAEVIAGYVHESAVPVAVRRAFEAQYPNLHEGFVHAVQRLSNDPDALRGLVNGVRGKLFEINYVDYLNHGHLPSGWSAHLAHSATNPCWDVSITDGHGHVDHVLQLKASASLELAKQALAAHPDVDVVVPHDVLEHFQNHTDMMSHLIDGHQTLDHLDHAMGIGVHHAEAAAIHFHVPYISVAFIVWTTFQRYRTGEISPMEALRKMTERITSSFLAVGAAYLAQAICHKSIIGIPVGIWVRYKTGKFFKKNELRRVIDQRIIFVREATSRLETELRSRKLVLALGD